MSLRNWIRRERFPGRSGGKERIRDVSRAPDGSIYLLTDYAKGRLLKLVKK